MKNYPFKVKTFKLKSQNQELNMRYMDVSSKSKDVVLLLHGKYFGSFYWEKVAWNNALTYGPIFTEDITSQFSKINNKTFFIIGTRDLTGPRRNWKRSGVHTKLGQYDKLGKITKKKINNSVLFELSALGHMPHFEDYKRFSKVFNKVFR